MSLKDKAEERTILDILLGGLLTLGGKVAYDAISKQAGKHIQEKIEAKFNDKENTRGLFFADLARMDRRDSANLEKYLDVAQNENFEGDFIERICAIPYNKDTGRREEMKYLSESIDYAMFKRRLQRLEHDNSIQWVNQAVGYGQQLKTAVGKGFTHVKGAAQDAFGAVGAGSGKLGEPIAQLNEFFIRREEARRKKKPLSTRIAIFLFGERT